MPFQHYCSQEDFQVGLWKISEDHDYFLKEYTFDPEELAEIAQKHPSHQAQQYASRAILNDLSITQKGLKIVKDHHGKPHIVNVQGEISISHSHNYAASIYAKQKLVGIDIQIATSKIARIAPKFISKEEFNYISEASAHDFYHIIWGAKESLYKAYGRRKVEFRDHLKVDPFVYSGKGHTIGHVDMPDYQGAFDIYFDKIRDFYLVFCVEKDKA